MSVVRTVAGDIAPAALGPTLMHEHLLCDITPLAIRHLPDREIRIEETDAIRRSWGVDHPGNHRLDDPALASTELARLVEAGGSGLVELTCGGMRPDPAGLAAIAQRTGLAIVMGCGYYTEAYAGEALSLKAVEALAGEMVGAVRGGAWGTTVRAGIIGEVGVSDPCAPAERRALEAAALAATETGAAIIVHPGRDPRSPFDCVATLTAAGADPARVVISHVDRTYFTIRDVLRLAETGCVISFDFFGIECAHYPFAPGIDLPNDGTRLAYVRVLIDHGHQGRVVLSHDICTRTRLCRWGGHGYAHLLRNVVPMMRRRGFAEAEIEDLFTRTPRRLLTLPAG
ncbi:MAG: aryldialkylphosphatase [Pseudomonadota bacterium]